MSKKTVFIIIALVILILGGFLAFVYTYFNKGVTPTPERQAGGNNLFPFGNGPQPTAASQPSASGQTATSTFGNQNQNAPIPALRHISTVPTAGAIAFTTGSTTMIRYTERGTGHIYEAKSDTLSQTRLSNITVPKIHEALWLTQSTFVIRYLDSDEATIVSFLGQIIPIKNASSTKPLVDAPTTTIDGTFLAKGIEEIAASPKKDGVFYTRESAVGIDGTTLATASRTAKTVFTSPFKDWLVQWAKDDTILFTTRPSVDSLGHAYLFNPQTGAMNKVFTSIRGLTTLANADASKILYSKSVGEDFTMSLFTIKTSTEEELLVRTFPEKCVWGNAIKTDLYCANPSSVLPGQYPDDWYKGKVHFNDTLWKIDTLTGEYTEIAKLKDLTGQNIDAIKLSLDEKDTYLVFTDKNDLTLWSLELSK